MQDLDEFFEQEKMFLIEYHTRIKDATQRADKMTKVHKSEAFILGIQSLVISEIKGLKPKTIYPNVHFFRSFTEICELC